jgi:hypothetical protein
MPLCRCIRVFVELERNVIINCYNDEDQDLFEYAEDSKRSYLSNVDGDIS